MVAYALAQNCDNAGARLVLDELKASSTRKYVRPHNIAMIYNGLGEKDEALEWLDGAYEDRDVRLIFSDS